MSETQRCSKRERRPPNRIEYVDPRRAVIDSSPPLSQASESAQSTGSDFQDDSNEIDEDEHEERRTKPEDVTLQLVHSFLQHALNLCLVQDPTTIIEVRLRIERRMCTAQVAKKYTFSAVDDGGICEMRRQNQCWSKRHPSIALLETKKAFKAMVFDNRAEVYKPVVSDETLAQYLGEALATWKSTRDYIDQDVFVIAATNTFLRVVHFKFGPSYANYIDAEDRLSQEELVDDNDPDTFAHMNSSRWFNLQTAGGQKSALCHILALIRWHEKRGVNPRPDLDDLDD